MAKTKKTKPKPKKTKGKTKPCRARGCTAEASDKWDFCGRHGKLLTKKVKVLWEEGDEDFVLDFLEHKDSLTHQAYGFEFSFTDEQAQMLYASCKMVRLCYNWGHDMLETWWWVVKATEPQKAKRRKKKRVPNIDRALPHLERFWAQRGTDKNPRPKPSYNDLNKIFTHEVFPTLKGDWVELPAASTRTYAFKGLSRAYKNYFEGRAKYPKKKKFGSVDTFALQPCSGEELTTTWIDRCVRPYAIDVTKLGTVKTKECTSGMEGRILRLVFEHNAGRWWVKCMVERQPKEERLKEFPDAVVGLDLGVNSILTLSRPYPGPNPPAFLSEDRQTIKPPRPLGVMLKKKRRLSKSWSRRGSSFYRKKLFQLKDGSLSLKAWKGRTPPGPFGSLLKHAQKLGHVQIQDDQVSLTYSGRLSLEPRSPQPRTYEHFGKTKIAYPPSKGWQRQKLVLAKLDRHIQNIRKDHINKISTWLVNTYGTIVCEGFDIKELVKKRGGKGAVRHRKRRREILDIGWGGLRVRLKYKMDPKWYGGTYLQLPKDEATDKTCHRCGTINEDLSPLTNTFRCVNDSCKLVMPRQENTALYCESFGRTPEAEAAQ